MLKPELWYNEYRGENLLDSEAQWKQGPLRSLFSDYPFSHSDRIGVQRLMACFIDEDSISQTHVAASLSVVVTADNSGMTARQVQDISGIIALADQLSSHSEVLGQSEVAVRSAAGRDSSVATQQ